MGTLTELLDKCPECRGTGYVMVSYRNTATGGWWPAEPKPCIECIRRGLEEDFGDDPIEPFSPIPNLTAGDLTPMQWGRLSKALDREYRFSVGIMTLRDYLTKYPPEYKKIYVQHYGRRKVHGCYPKLTTPKVEYTIWRDGIGSAIPKIVWDILDIEEVTK